MNKPLCLLLIHGFGGSVKEVEPLAARLNGMGLTVFMAKIAGHHGIDGKHIDNISYEKWINSVRLEVRRLEQTYQVIPVGFSMGGLIAATLNDEVSFSGMVFINTPIFFWNLPQVTKNLLLDFKTASSYYHRSAVQVTPYSTIQFLRLLLHAHGLFKNISCPALVVQAKDDDSVWPISAYFICKNLRKTPWVYLAKSGGHQVLANKNECKIIAEKVSAFYHEIYKTKNPNV